MQHIYLFHGENSYSSSQKIRRWQQEFAKKYGSETLEVLDGGKLNTAEFTTNITSIPLLAEKRLMIVKDFFAEGEPEDQKKVAENLENAAPECIIVFYETSSVDKRGSLYKKISKIGIVEEFPALDPGEISKWIMEESGKQNIRISFSNANYLSQYCHSDLWCVSNELKKLQTYANGQEITQKMIEEISTASLSASIFKLTDAIAQRNQKQSLKTFSILAESGEDIIRVFFMIVRHFRILIQVQEMIQKGERPFTITKRLNQHPFVIQKTSEQSRNFNAQKLQKIHGQLLEIDRKFKTGLIKTYAADNRALLLAIEKLIIDCCQPD